MAVESIAQGFNVNLYCLLLAKLGGDESIGMENMGS